jgi:predicted ATP-grasp superfamily ATP-dependent carboligase
MVLPPHQTVLRTFDKEQTTQLAASLGIAVAETVVIDGRTPVAALARSISYPAVLKPRVSEEVSPAGQIHATGRPRYARNPDEFMSAYGDLRQRCSAILAQEFIAGTGAGYFGLMWNGELRAEFAHRRIRDVRPTGSGSAVRVSIAPEPALREAALALLRALNWHGVAMVEFRIRPDGTPVFMEVNGRFWNSLSLAVHAGVDFPALLADLAEGRDVKPPDAYRAAVRCRWLLGDFRHLLEVWRGAPSAYPGTYPSRVRTTVDFFTPVRGTKHDNFVLSDPLPEVGDWLDFVFRRLLARRST